MEKISFDKETLERLLNISENIHNIADIDILLDKILYELCRFTNSDGGIIFLIEDNQLTIKYIQNNSLFRKNPNIKFQYLDKRFEINNQSIAGAAVINKKSIMIKDVYNITEDCHCSFNREFDLTSNYRTKSILAIPLKTEKNTIIGVIQLVNAKDEKGNITSFSEKDRLFANYFAKDAAVAIEKAKTTRSVILKMLKMVELRDPKETGEHVNRIGMYAVEIYSSWAKNRGLPEELIRRFNDKLRIAAMLHDIGKIGISDTILKKPDKLNEDELKIMKMHTIIGFRLFKDSQSEIENMAAEIALNHHEKWDGTGYPGNIDAIDTIEFIQNEKGKKEKEIPLTARIVSLADVYDALSTKRVYKEKWDEEKVIDYIKNNSGKHFDPEIVDAFFSCYDTIKFISQKFNC